MDLNAYRKEGEAFVSGLATEHYLHFAGLKPSLDVEPIYEAHSWLFTPKAAEELASARSPALLEFCVEGLAGRRTAAEAAELARLEAQLELPVDGASVPFRRAPIEQAVERDPERRAAIESARNEAIERELNPLYRRTLGHVHALAEELGWPSTTVMCAELSGIDLPALGRTAQAFLRDTDEAYERDAKPRLHAELEVSTLRRSDVPAFFRAPSLDVHFPAERLVSSLDETLTGLGVDAWQRVKLDAESRPTKSPRAFCVAVRVPHEVYLVTAPHGGRDDYETILHEAGHAQHYAHVAPDADFERRHLGDNSVTEAYAFLLQRLAAEPAWLERHLGVEDAGEVVEHARAAKLVLLRRYAAKLQYEIELHEATEDLSGLRSSYARGLGRALGIEWPETTWLSDVDPFFYAARYLRAWAFEAELARELAGTFGSAWFTEPEAGRRLRELWAEGQPRTASELLGHEPDFSALTAELTGS